MLVMGSSFNGVHSASRIMNGQSNIMNNYEIVDWSAEEQHILEDGHIKFSGEPPLLKYSKIASLLKGKTIRDVALRCNWMKRKGRAPNVGKVNMAPDSHGTYNVNYTTQYVYEGPGLYCRL